MITQKAFVYLFLWIGYSCYYILEQMANNLLERIIHLISEVPILKKRSVYFFY